MNVVRSAAAMGAAAVLVLGAAPAALAADATYPPSIPTRAAGVCEGPTPHLAYTLDFGGNAPAPGSPMTITFVNPGGENYVINSTTPNPGTEQRVLWPGASVSPPDWPGWVQDANGQWVESTTDAGAFTRAPGGVEVRFGDGPTLTTTVTYPAAGCGNPPNMMPTVPVPGTSGGADSAGEMPKTGASVLPAVIGGAALLVGGGLFAASRRRGV